MPFLRAFMPLKANGRLQIHKPTGSLAADGAPKKNIRACPGSNQPPKG